MRCWWIAISLLAACQKPAGQSPAPPQLTFEGANAATQAAKIAHGRRLTAVLGCSGCHGANLQGHNMVDNPADGPMYSPNVTLALGKYRGAELEQLIRHGVPRDGREFWFMPVESYQFLSDQDFAAITAYLRTLKPQGRALPAFKFNRVEQKDVDHGLMGNAQAQIRKYRDNPPADLGPQHGWGRYLVEATCTACHNNALQGWTNFTPDLDIAGAYSKSELTRLLTTGQSKTGKDVGMSKVARRQFSHLTPREREAIVDYILARASRPR